MLSSIFFKACANGVPVLKSLKRWRLEENQISWMKIGMTPLVNSKEELALWINNYLKDPDIHKSERKVFKDTYCGKYDGKSAERIADSVLDY